MSTPLPKTPNSIQQRIERRQRRMKIVRYGIFLPSMLIGAVTGVGAMIWPSATTVETGQSREYQDLQPQYFNAPISSLASALENTVEAHARLHSDPDSPARVDETNAQFHVIAKGPYVPTTTKIRVTIHRSQSGRSAVNMRADSASGVKTDFGQRARNIRFLQKEINDRLPRHAGILGDDAAE